MARKGALLNTSLHKNGFGLANLQHKPALNVLPWPQEGLVYIDLKLVTISHLPPKIWPKKGSNIPPKGPKSLKSAENPIKKSLLYSAKTTFCNILDATPNWLAPGHMEIHHVA
jgi:hypothetical protein